MLSREQSLLAAALLCNGSVTSWSKCTLYSDGCSCFKSLTVFFFTPHWNKQTEWISYIGTYMWKHKGMFWRKIYKVVSFHGNWVRFTMVYLTMMHFAAILSADKHKPAAWKYKGGAVADFRTQLQSVTSPIAQTTPAAPGLCCRHDFVHKAEKRKSLFCRGFLNMQQGSVSKPVGGDSQRFFSAFFLRLLLALA